MAFVTNQALFRINQEFLALSASDSSISCSVDCFTVSKKPTSPSSPPFDSRLSAAAFGYPPQGTSSISAPHSHFHALLSAFCSGFPDYDFSEVRPWNFKLLSTPEEAQATVNWAFLNRLSNSAPTLTHLWFALEKEISPATCSIYQYDPDRPDGFSESGVTFNLCVFFLNEKLSRVVLVHLRVGGSDAESDGGDDDGDDLEVRYGFGAF
jgi:hypothetical protein